MIEILIILFSITAFFSLAIITQSLFNWPPCALCFGVVVTWLGGLFLYWSGAWDNLILFGVLLGASLTGSYYLLEKKVSQKWHIFRLPFFLSALILIYFFLGQIEEFQLIILFLFFLWALFFFLYLLKDKPAVKKLLDQLLACCRDW